MSEWTKRGSALALGIWIAACASFSDAAPPGGATSDGGDAGDPSADGGGTVDAPTGDAGTGLCASPVASESASFATGKTIALFEEVNGGGASIAWNATEGSNGTGALEAKTTMPNTQAQIERDFPIGAATRARISFAARIPTLPAASTRVVFGCTLQLATAPIDGGRPFVEIFFLLKDGSLRFDQDSSSGGSSINSIAIDNPTTEWRSYVLDVSDITTKTLRYRALYGGKDVTPTDGVITLQSPPDYFHVKCGIDDSEAAVTVLVDDVSFEMCTP